MERFNILKPRRGFDLGMLVLSGNRIESVKTGELRAFSVNVGLTFGWLKSAFVSRGWRNCISTCG